MTDVTCYTRQRLRRVAAEPVVPVSGVHFEHMAKPTRTLLTVIALVALAVPSPLSLLACSDSGEMAPVEKPLTEEDIGRYTLWWALSQDNYQKNRWFGVKTLQNPLDAWIIQEIIYEVRPDFIVETGTFKGGSAALWAVILEHVNPAGRVITIDITDVTQQAKQLPIVQRKVDFLVGSSVDPAIVAEVKERVSGGRTLVILDSLHTRDHVLAELWAYAPLVDVGSYLIVQDTGLWQPIRNHPGGWASDAVEEFIAESDAFVADQSRERFWLTNCPSSWLKRVR
jgi:cephalosporin hydroxylase